VNAKHKNSYKKLLCFFDLENNFCLKFFLAKYCKILSLVTKGKHTKQIIFNGQTTNFKLGL